MTTAARTTTATLEHARAAKTAAKAAERNAAGRVLALTILERDKLPAHLARAVDSYNETKAALLAAQSTAIAVSQQKFDESPAAVAIALERATLDALIAHYIAGSVVIAAPPVDGQPFRWQVEEPGTRKRKALPQYSADVGTAMQAEKQLPATALDSYGKHLAVETFDNCARPYTARLAMAGARERCRAMLHTVGIDPDSPPAWARDRKSPGVDN